jgi:hypothetical protein
VAGSIVIGILAVVSVTGLVAFCMACELAAIPLIWIAGVHGTHSGIEVGRTGGP